MTLPLCAPAGGCRVQLVLQVRAHQAAVLPGIQDVTDSQNPYPSAVGQRGVCRRARAAEAGSALRGSCPTPRSRRNDPEGRNVFAGGFLGLDNVVVFDRSAPLPNGGHLDRADGTAWMAFYCQNMLEIALTLA